MSYNVSCGCGTGNSAPCMGGLGSYQNYVFGQRCSPAAALRFCQRAYPCPAPSYSVAQCVHVQPQPDKPQAQQP